ncbi:MAG: hypothetical protein QW356_06305 [Candidatus Hadarchaeales archaeon]
MPTSVTLEALFPGLRVFGGGRATVEVEELTDEEIKAVKDCIADYTLSLSRVSPPLADLIRAHEQFFLSCAKVAKGIFPTSKPIRYPSEPGTIGVMPIAPQFVRYKANVPSDYDLNTWNVSLTAGTPCYLLGSATAWYKTSSDTGKYTLLAIPKDGIVGVGSAPPVNQLVLSTEIQQKYSAWFVQPLRELSDDPDRPIFQFNTLGSLMLTHNLGVRLGMMPYASGTYAIKLLGLGFYEHDFLGTATLVWIT